MLTNLLGFALLMSLLLYVLFAGADFGGGVWDLFARGSRANAQRRLIESAITPVWETNHVWLILAIVLLFSVYPPVYGRLSRTLAVPLELLLLGILFRGAAFVFRQYGRNREAPLGPGWGKVFAVASLFTPIFLGIAMGSVASGDLVESAARGIWFRPFPILCGLLTLSAFAFLAAVYLTCETPDLHLQEDFRQRALLAGFCTTLFAVGLLTQIPETNPHLRFRLLMTLGGWGIRLIGLISATAAFSFLFRRRFFRARASAVVAVSTLLMGLAGSNYPYLIYPDLTIYNASAPAPTLWAIGIALLLGSLILFPSLLWLFKLFKSSDRSRS